MTKINWTFLRRCFEQRGFCKKWCDWIWDIMISGTLRVKVHDSLGNYFMCGKGVRQGDPLSHLLFNMAADVLAKMINLAQENSLITGLADAYVEHGVAILQYADSILCLKDEVEMARNTKLLLYCFKEMSGLKINFDRSEVVWEKRRKGEAYTTLRCLTALLEIGLLNN